MPIPSLIRKQSSLSALIERERSLSGASRVSEVTRESREPEEAPAAEEKQEQVKPTAFVPDEGGDTDIEGGDTDIEEEPPVPLKPTLSKQKTVSIKEVREDGSPQLRMSRRLMSMKRRGKIVLLRELTDEFEFNAEDVLTVRGEEDDFYVCRVLEDVPLNAKRFRVAWYNRVGPNLYEPSFDDVCDMNSVITRVGLIERINGQVSVIKKYIKQTKRLLREALAAERGQEVDEIEDIDKDEGDEEEEEEDEEEEPPAKRTRSSDHTPVTRKGGKGKRKTATPKKAITPKKPRTPKQKTPKKKAPPKDKPRRTGVLIPNPEIELLHEDPTFETRQDWGLMPCKLAIRATMLGDIRMLKDCIENIKEVHTPHWPRSPDVGMCAIHYALINNNKKAVDMLVDDLIHPKEGRCKKPKVTLDHMDTGSYNFHTFGHAVREIYASRGSREGNNAFLHDQRSYQAPHQLLNSLLEFCFQNPKVPLEMVEYLVEKLMSKKKLSSHNGIQKVWKAIRCGNRKVAGYFVKKAIEKEGFGFNFLHKEVLVNDKEPLTKFRSQSVKKKPYENKFILPIHAACINPNGQYLKQLLESVPEYNVADRDGYKPIHYASACEGTEPLKILLARGVDPNDLAPGGLTPIMIASKYGRDENIETLLAREESTGHDFGEEEEEEAPQPRVQINAKSRTAEAAIHYAAINGHANTIRILVAHGANINLQTASGKGNATALMLGAMHGHLDVVKTCVELGGGADKRGKWRMTALMYAVKNGHSTIAAYLLRLGVDPNAVDTSGNTPVHYAAAYGWLHCLQLLIKAGANPNASNQWKTTPLALSMLKDHIKCTDYLLDLDSCDVNVPDDNGQTLLSQTISKLKVSETLLARMKYLVEEKGADVKTSDIRNWTPLHHLAANSVYKSPQRISKKEWLNIPAEDANAEKSPQQVDTSQKQEEPADGDEDMDDADDDKMDDEKEDDNESDDHLDNDDDDDDDHVSDDGDDGSDDCDDDDDEDDDDHSYDSDESENRVARSCIVPSWDCVTTLPRFSSSRAKVSCDIAEILFMKGADLDAVDETGQTAMMIAILQHNYPLVQKLIELGAKASAGKNKQGRQIVHLLAEQEDQLDLREFYPEETEPLLSGTIDEQLKLREKYLKSLLTRASTEMLKTCIDAEAELSAVDEDGLTPLMVALNKSNTDMFEVLLNNNANPAFGLQNTGQNILHKLSAFGWNLKAPLLMKQVANMLDKSTRMELAGAVDNTGFTPLLQACEALVASHKPKDWNGQCILEILIDDFGADPTARVGKIKKGEKIQRRSPSTLGLTVNRKKDEKEEEDEYGVTGKFSCLHFLTLHYDHEKKDEKNELLDLLFEKLSSSSDIINSRDRHGRTPLHLAINWHRPYSIEPLVKRGANVNLLSEDERDLFATPLIMVCRPSLQYDEALCLLQMKADPNLVDKDGRSALSHAVANDPDSSGERLRLAKTLLEAGAQVNSIDKKGRSILHYTVNKTTGGFETLTELEDLLLKYGADTAARDSRGRIPLHYAFVKIGRHTDSSLSDPVYITSLLVEAMAEQHQDVIALLNHADNYGQTPLHRAAIRGSTLCVLNLLKKGARLDVQDNNGNTPLSLAIRENHNSCAMALMQMNAPPDCTVITPVTPQQMEDYKKEKERARWIWKELSNVKAPQPVIRSAFQAVVEHDWQGVAYLMLEVAGLDFIVALRAVLGARKVNLAWTLLRKQKKDVFVQGVDDKGRNILHLLALHTTRNENNDVVEKIAVHLLQRGVSPSSLDKEGAIPLHYASCNGNGNLCQLLLRYNPSTINTVHPSGMTALACSFDCTNSSYNFKEIFISAKPKTLDVCYKVGGLDDLKQDTTTPLIEACFENDTNLVVLLLESGASVNFAKANGRTPLMEVVRANMEDMAKLLLYGTKDRAQWKGNKTKVNMAATDSEGKTVIHHCIQSREYGSHENVTMLLLLAKFDAPLEVPDIAGKTPLHYAMQQRSGKMREALADFIEDKSQLQDGEETMDIDQELGFQFDSTLNAYWEGPEPDVDADSEAMLTQARDLDEVLDNEDDTNSKPPPVDDQANVENGEVYIDPNTGIPYDILMTKVDVKYGMYGLNNFYKMQVVHHKGKDLWVLLNRWGRIGSFGQHQRTPFRNPADATLEFRRIFRSKTGNNWEDKENFEKKPKKYALVSPERNPEFKHKKAHEILKPFDLEKCPPSRLPKQLQELMKQMTDVEFLNQFLRNLKLRNLLIDINYMPFGRLSTDTINKAREILLSIKKIVSGIDMEKLKAEEHKFEQIADLSNSYFMLIPMANYAYESISPLNEVRDIDAHLNAIEILTELAYTSKLLLAAQYRAKETNPLDYCYRALGAHVELIDCESDECQQILKYIQNSKATGRSHFKFDVQSMYRISRPGENQLMTSCGVPSNHRLLWHGTKTANLMGILKQGLRIAPPEAPTTGWSLGKGIYFSDSLEKSLSYSDLNDYRGSNTGFVLLSEVALGCQYEYQPDSYDPTKGPPTGYNSMWLTTKKFPLPSHDVTTPYGAVIPSGPHIDNIPLIEKYKQKKKPLQSGWYSHNEYVVYSEAQVQQRYIVCLKK